MPLHLRGRSGFVPAETGWRLLGDAGITNGEMACVQLLTGELSLAVGACDHSPKVQRSRAKVKHPYRGLRMPQPTLGSKEIPGAQNSPTYVRAKGAPDADAIAWLL